MNINTILNAHKNLNKKQYLFLRYVDGIHTLEITTQDTLENSHDNDLHITNQGKWLDCEKICFMRIFKTDEEGMRYNEHHQQILQPC